MGFFMGFFMRFFVILAIDWQMKNPQIQDIESENSKLRYETRKSSVVLNKQKSIANWTAGVFPDKDFSELHKLLKAKYGNLTKEPRLTFQNAGFPEAVNGYIELCNCHERSELSLAYGTRCRVGLKPELSCRQN